MPTIAPASSRGLPPCSICSRPVAMPWDDPAPIYELLAERCRHVRVALEVMTGCE